MCFYAKANVSPCIYNKPHFASQRTSARIEFLRQGGRLVGKMAAIMLNFVLKTLHKYVGRGVVAVRFFSFVVGFLSGVSLICRTLGWLFPLCKVSLACLATLVCLVSLAYLDFVVLVSAWLVC